jgi:hypothetical protein
VEFEVWGKPSVFFLNEFFVVKSHREKKSAFERISLKRFWAQLELTLSAVLVSKFPGVASITGLGYLFKRGLDSD